MLMTEKRRSERKQVILHALVSHGQLGRYDAPMSVETLNLSKRGALIESADPIFESEVCNFSLTTNNGQSANIQGRIVWVTKVADGINRAGVSFRNLTADEEYMIELQLARSSM